MVGAYRLPVVIFAVLYYFYRYKVKKQQKVLPITEDKEE